MSSMHFLAASQLAASTPAMKMEPSSLMSILAPVSATIFWITLPPEPMTSRILEGSMCMVSILGAYLLTSLRGSEMAGSMIWSRISHRAS